MPPAQAMEAGDPSARWIMQAWLFFNEGFFWKPPQIQVLLRDAWPLSGHEIAPHTALVAPAAMYAHGTKGYFLQDQRLPPTVRVRLMPGSCTDSDFGGCRAC